MQEKLGTGFTGSTGWLGTQSLVPPVTTGSQLGSEAPFTIGRLVIGLPAVMRHRDPIDIFAQQIAVLSLAQSALVSLLSETYDL